ncbi:hypothetical protein BU17DRAFT_82606 [Hysterangium stoloniferum]|nr:hypothetical protein BU17DRAFT_82606 [Hysterangium stoloniferum]
MDGNRIASEKASPDLPFELWRPIFQIVFATKTCISNPKDSDWEFSPLHARLNVYRCLASVSRTWRVNARDVFLEQLDVFTQDALAGLIRLFQNARHLALAVSRISFSFGEFRCSASVPRRPRALRSQYASVSQAIPNSSQPQFHPVYNPPPPPDWKVIHRRTASKYQPSSTAQGRHWARWHADVAQLLAMCTSLSEVSIDSTNQYYYINGPITHWFPPPDMTNDHIITSLSHSSNLKSLSLVDPTPLEMYGPALTSWDLLENLSIELTRDFPELASTEFIPPKSLTSFRFHDGSSGVAPWPLASDLARCTNLQVLDLAIASLHPTTMMAIGFLFTSYQHSLRELVLSITPGGALFNSISFQSIFESSKLHFTNLERLRLLQANYDTTIFSYFTAEKLKYVEVHWLDVGPGQGSLEEKWSRGFAHSSLKAVTEFVIKLDDHDAHRKNALMKVCEELGINLIMGQSPTERGEVARVDDDEPDFEVVAI